MNISRIFQSLPLHAEEIITEAAHLQPQSSDCLELHGVIFYILHNQQVQLQLYQQLRKLALQFS